MAEFKIDIEALGKKCFDEFQRILMDEYGMTLDELAELCKAKQEGRMREDVQAEWIKDNATGEVYCSGCEWNAIFTAGHYYSCTAFCPNCGARMTGGGER